MAPPGLLQLRLLAVSEPAVLVLDAVTGKGSHKIVSRLHLHPDPPDTQAQILALGAEAMRREAPYHERFGETREMTCLEVESSSSLPWVVGWLMLCDRAVWKSGPVEVKCDVDVRQGIARLRCRGGFEWAACWRFSALETAAGAVSLCSPVRESAT